MLASKLYIETNNDHDNHVYNKTSNFNDNIINPAMQNNTKNVKKTKKKKRKKHDHSKFLNNVTEWNHK